MRIWSFLLGIAIWVLLIVLLGEWRYVKVDTLAQTMNLDRKSTVAAVRDIIGEPSTAYIPDSAMIRMVNYAMIATVTALKEKTVVMMDTIVTTTATLRYPIRPSATDSTLAGHIAMVIQKDATASGGGERSLMYIPIDMVGQTLVGPTPAFYTIVENNFILGQSTLGGDTITIYTVPIGRNLETDTTKLGVSKEDQVAVIYMAASLAYARDKQIQLSQMYFQMWQAQMGFKGYPKLETKQSQ